METTAEAPGRISATFLCPHCHRTTSAMLHVDDQELACHRCGEKTPVKVSVSQDRLLACPMCGCDELFWRKDFPQRLGVTIVVLGFLISCVTWYFHMLIATFGVLLLMALIDVTLYVLVGDLLECYRCHGQYRGCPRDGRHDAFDLETFEKHRQIAARKASGPRGA